MAHVVCTNDMTYRWICFDTKATDFSSASSFEARRNLRYASNGGTSLVGWASFLGGLTMKNALLIIATWRSSMFYKKAIIKLTNIRQGWLYINY